MAQAFKLYKNKNHRIFQTYKFGKDVTYNRPPSAVTAELSHVHLVPIEQKGDTSDRFLVYSTGFNDSEAFILLAILEPNAHELSRNTLQMANLADIAEKFRNQF